MYNLNYRDVKEPFKFKWINSKSASDRTKVCEFWKH